MKKSFAIWPCLGLLLRIILPIYAASTGFYFDFNDCSDGSMVKFRTSVTPYPLLYINNKFIWLGGRVNATKLAQQFIENYTEEEFVDGLYAQYFLDVVDLPPVLNLFDPKPTLISQLIPYNNTPVCGKLLEKELCQAFYHVIRNQASNVVVFMPLDFNNLLRNQLHLPEEFISSNMLPLPVHVKIHYTVTLESKTISCIEWDMYLKSEPNLNFDKQLHKEMYNVEASFSTPKFIDVRQNGSRNCPPESVELIDGACQCTLPNKAGPFCDFQCNFPQIKASINEQCDNPKRNMTPVGCTFSEKDYLNLCLANQNVPLLQKNSFIAVPIGLEQINIEWKLINYFSTSGVFVDVQLYANGESQGSLKTSANPSPDLTCVFHFEGLTNYLNLTEILPKSNSNSYRIQLRPFTDYSIDLVLRSNFIQPQTSLKAGTTNFTSPEVLPQNLRITQVRLLDNQIEIDWETVGQCPGNIRHIQSNVSCECDGCSELFFHNDSLPHDCRLNASGPALNVLMPKKCENKNLSVRLRAATTGQFGSWSSAFEFIAPNNNFPFEIIGALLGTAALVILFVIGFAFRKHRHQKAQLAELYAKLKASTLKIADNVPLTLDPQLALISQADDLPYVLSYEIDISRLTMGQEIGRGEFGCVLNGTLRQQHVSDSTCSTEKVAVKQLRPGSNSIEELKALLNELKIMIYIGSHVNVVRLIGGVTKYLMQLQVFIIMEFCELGSLLNVLRDNASKITDANTRGYTASLRLEQFAPESADREKKLEIDLLLYAYQIANGMIYISNKKVIHRDLAARNVLVTADKVVKIADCGLARHDPLLQYVRNQNGSVPVTSMALETFETSCYSVHSDVWSYGVLLWEIFSLGAEPFNGFQNHEIYRFWKEGQRLNRPSHASCQIYEELMLNCWLEEPVQRPSFVDCRDLIEKEVRDRSPNELTQLNEKLMVDIVQIDQRIGSQYITTQL